MKKLLVAIACAMAAFTAMAAETEYPVPRPHSQESHQAMINRVPVVLSLEIDLYSDQNISRVERKWASGFETFRVVGGRTSAGKLINLGAADIRPDVERHSFVVDLSVSHIPVRWVIVETTVDPTEYVVPLTVWSGGALQYGCSPNVPGAGWVIADSVRGAAECTNTAEHIRYTFMELSEQPSGSLARVCNASHAPADWGVIRVQRGLDTCPGMLDPVKGTQIPYRVIQKR